MYGKNESDLRQFLFNARDELINRNNGNRIKAEQQLAEDVIADRIALRDYDPYRLANQIEKCCSNGASLDLNDPFLLKGGVRRPSKLNGNY